MHFYWGQTAAIKRRNVTTLSSAHQAKKKKKKCNFDSGWLEQQCNLHSFF